MLSLGGLFYVASVGQTLWDLCAYFEVVMPNEIVPETSRKEKVSPGNLKPECAVFNLPHSCTISILDYILVFSSFFI